MSQTAHPSVSNHKSADLETDNADQSGQASELEFGMSSLSLTDRPQKCALLQARVYQWNQVETKVICPRCDESHDHPGTRGSHYNDPPVYDAPCRDGYKYQLLFGTYREISSKKSRIPYWIQPSWKEYVNRRQALQAGRREISQGPDELLGLDSDNTTLRSLRLRSPFDSTATLRLGNRKIREWKLSRPSKTMGLLLRGHGVKPISTESGWTKATNLHEGCHKLDSPEYTAKGMQRCISEGFKLPRTGCDQKVPGQFNACLASMQLITWYLENHVILDSDYTANPALIKLKEIEPKSKSQVVILVSQSPRTICVEYARHIELIYNVEFTEIGPYT